ncbi:MAG: hypothetical protein Q8K65_00645 [Alphaproteobacteria bacterium]|nr:hypothetical protein [Alphaproteobacteria bacterium]
MTLTTKFAGFATGFAAVCLLAVLPAFAQWGAGTTGGEYRPRISTAEEVAIVQHVFAADPPSATEWARHSKEYLEANDFDRESVLDVKRREYIEKFRLFAKPETLVIGANIMLSSYSAVNKGFIIESFNDQTFFSYDFAGQKYAVVIPKLMEYQWMSVEPDIAEKLHVLTVGATGRVRMILEVEPKFADKKPIELKGALYRLLAGEVASISIIAPLTGEVLWVRNGPGRAEKVRGNMMKLYDRAE